MKQTDHVDRETTVALSKRAWQIYVESPADRGPLDVATSVQRSRYS